MLITSTVNVQKLLAGIVAPDSLMLVEEAGAVTVPNAQVVDAFGVVATTRFAGSVSVNAAAVRGMGFGLSILITSDAKLPGVRFAEPVVNPTGLPVSRVYPPIAL